MSGKRVLLDTNILVYAYDRSEADKQAQAKFVLRHLTHMQLACISTQVTAEFFVTTTRKLAYPLTIPEVEVRFSNFQQSFTIFPVTPAVVMEASRAVRTYQLSFWDAQIWATAKLNQVEYIFSEDFQSGISLEGIQVINPLLLDFEIDLWV